VIAVGVFACYESTHQRHSTSVILMVQFVEHYSVSRMYAEYCGDPNSFRCANPMSGSRAVFVSRCPDKSGEADRDPPDLASAVEIREMSAAGYFQPSARNTEKQNRQDLDTAVCGVRG
jgi:hypothetical protein